jgi:hydrogenase maturation protease
MQRVKPILVVGLGNSLAGDDGLGGRVVEWLVRHRAIHDQADFVLGGSDLLRMAERCEGRREVVLIDALLSDDEPGTVSVFREPFDGLDGTWQHAHGPSVVQEIALLKLSSPALRATSFILIGIAVPELRHEATLLAHVPAIAARVGVALAHRISVPLSP